MKCDCIKIIEERLSENCKTQKFNKPFKNVEIEQAFVMAGNGMETKTYSRAFIELEGQKKKNETKIIHSHCPFCGIKMSEDE